MSRVPLEDELGDILEKGLRRAGLTVEAASAQANIDPSRLQDAIDYRDELTSIELRRLAATLNLNEVGLCAVAREQYPLPRIGELPFNLWPLRMRHGVGVVNAYIVAEVGSSHGLLFDVGPALEALTESWPGEIEALDAVFLTHVESEHAGGLCGLVARFGVTAAFVPETIAEPCGSRIGEGEIRRFGAFEVTVFSTPGHAAAHNCYLVGLSGKAEQGQLLISGDLIFAGSAGGGYFCHRRLQVHLRRVLTGVPAPTVIAPGHGPLTTAENELRFNPFVV